MQVNGREFEADSDSDDDCKKHKRSPAEQVGSAYCMKYTDGEWSWCEIAVGLCGDLDLDLDS